MSGLPLLRHPSADESATAQHRTDDKVPASNKLSQQEHCRQTRTTAVHHVMSASLQASDSLHQGLALIASLDGSLTPMDTTAMMAWPLKAVELASHMVLCLQQVSCPSWRHAHTVIIAIRKI